VIGMMFDVGIRMNKQSARFYRVHDTMLSVFIRRAQNEGKYVFSIIALFMKKDKEWPMHTKHFSQSKSEEVNKQVVDPIGDRIMIDPHGF
jgi:hypothetical protein